MMTPEARNRLVELGARFEVIDCVDSLITAAEVAMRERCAKECDPPKITREPGEADRTWGLTEYEKIFNKTRRECAAAIRALPTSGQHPNAPEG